MSMKEMWKYLMFQTKGYRIVEVVIVVGAVCGAGAAYVNSVLYAGIIDALGGENYGKAMRLTVLMVVAVWLVRVLCEACNRVFEQYAEPSMAETKKRTAYKAFTMEYEELEKEETLNAFHKVRAGEMGSGSIRVQLELIYAYFLEVAKVTFSFGFLIMLVARASFGTGLSLWKTAVMTVILLLLFAVTFRVNYIISDKIGKRQVEMNIENERANSLGMYLFSILGTEKYAKDIRLCGLQDYFAKKYEASFSVCRVFTEFGVFEGKYNAVFSFVTQVLAGYIYVYVAVTALVGTISAGDVLMYAGAIVTMMSGVQTILTLHTQIRYINEYLKTYEAFIEKPNMHYDGTLPIEKRDDNRYELSFQNVSFRYPGTDRYILKNIAMKFEIGQKLALVGLNGAGKTTLIKLLLRFYEPTEGEIQLNGIDIAKYDYEEYMRIFSVVFQDFGLFDFPLDENISGGTVPNPERVREVIEKAGLTNLVSGLPEGEHTLLYHENGDGVALSGGEAQKVAIARALYKDAPFVILDEPTAALDPVAEAEIYENFDVLVGDKTAIYVSHRMSSCKFCDRIVVLSEGEIAEEGDHEALLQKGGIYAGLYRTQAQYYNEG